MNKYIKKASVLAVALGATASLPLAETVRADPIPQRRRSRFPLTKATKIISMKSKAALKRRTTSRLS